MNKIRIRRLEPGDMEKIGGLLRTREELDEEGAKKRAQLLEWLAFNNPFADGDPTYFVAEDEGRIVGMLGRMPTKFVVNGKTTRGYFIQDLYVHPESRKKGMGFFLSMALSKALEKNSKSFCCGIWTSHFTLQMQKQRGYHELSAPRYVKFFNPIKQLESKLGKKSLVKILNAILTRILFLTDFTLLKLAPSNIQVSRVNRFDSRFDHFNQRILHKLGVSSFKESSYLNWKFVDRPFSKMEVFATEESGQITGFIVIGPNSKKDYPEGAIVDIMADPGDRRTISALLREATKYFRKKNVFSIECCLTDKRFIKILKRFLFLKVLEDEPVTLANLEKCEEKDFLLNIDNWHLTSGESDKFMLRP